MVSLLQQKEVSEMVGAFTNLLRNTQRVWGRGTPVSD